MNKIEPRKRQREKSAGGKTWYKPTSRARGAGQTPLEFAENLSMSYRNQRNHHPPTRPAPFRIPSRARKSDTTQKKNSATIKRIQTESSQKSSSLPRKNIRFQPQSDLRLARILGTPRKRQRTPCVQPGRHGRSGGLSCGPGSRPSRSPASRRTSEKINKQHQKPPIMKKILEVVRVDEYHYEFNTTSTRWPIRKRSTAPSRKSRWR